MSGPRIIAQGVIGLVNAFPGWKLPTHCNVRATIGSVPVAGTPTPLFTESDQGDAPTTVGWSISRVSAGVYDLLFPAVRRWAPGTFLAATKTITQGAFAVGDLRPGVIDRSTVNTNPRGVLLNGNLATGRIRIGFFTNAGAVPSSAELADNLEINASVWVDYGS